MAYQKITRESYGGRVVNSFKGIIMGIILLIIGSVLLFWNEGRAVRMSDTIGEAREAVVEMADVTRADSAFDGKLVFAIGKADTDDVITDAISGVSENAVSLKRSVEYYQWEETSKSVTRKKLGGGTETVTTYDYRAAWTDEPVDSARFENIAGHENVTLLWLEDETLTAPNVTFGAYTIPDFMKPSVGKDEPAGLSVPEDKLAELNRQVVAGTADGANYITAKGGIIYIGASTANPKVGDVRITYTQRKPAEISLLAVVDGDTFRAFKSFNGGELWLVRNGASTPEEMFESMEMGNSVITWVLRGVGAILVMVGIGLIFAPLSVIADVIPLFGSVIGAGTGLAAFLLGFAWSFILIAVAWFAYRPLLGIGLFAVALLLIVLLSLRGRSRKKKRAAVNTSPQSTPRAAPAAPPTSGAQPAPGYCHNCGAQLAPGAKFCPGCGTQTR